uniref:RCK C-terminal domain-containing protein n=1 Tax=Pseudo-nitzschia australis TaxID=44445 RepID=A0A7S4EIS4_9STRA
MNDIITVAFSAENSNDTCPCAASHFDSSLVTAIAAAATDRLLQQADDTQTDGTSSSGDDDTQEQGGNSLFQIIYTCGVLFLMFGALISDRIGADSVMMASLTLFMAASIITIPEGLEGFANEGLLTVLVLFVVAEGISKTGALDWYMSKLLGRPNTVASAQSRLMIPIAIISAFLNNTPVVAVMIPIVQKWSKSIGQSAQQLLVPLSFASILGGTCTLIGTSTNLVVAGLLEKQYPDIKMGLFDLSIYGVPIAMIGIVYVLLGSPCLLPGGTGASCRGGTGTSAIDITGGSGGNDGEQDLLLGAKLMPWSPAAGRSVKRSGLRDTGGIYLVSVHRAATGNVHRAVGQDFVLNVGDVLYFTGLVEEFGDFCEEHGMEVLTNEIEEQEDATLNEGLTKPSQNMLTDTGKSINHPFYAQSVTERQSNAQLVTVLEGAEEEFTDVERGADTMPVMEVGFTKESLLQADEAERSRIITRMIDMVRGVAREEPTQAEDKYLHKDIRERGRKHAQHGAHKVVVTSENGFVVVGVDARDRPGLLLDVSKGLLRLNLTLRHSEASVVGARSISIWRCEVIEAALPDLEEIWTVMNGLLESFDQGNSQAMKRGGLRVIRAVVTATSNLNGKNMNNVDFRDRYKAAVVAIQKGGRNVPVTGVVFGSGDVLVLKANDDSPLLIEPPPDFYKRGANDGAKGETGSRGGSSGNSFIKRIKKRVSNATLNTLNSRNSEAELKESKQNNAYDALDLEAAKMNNDVDASFDNADDFYIGEMGQMDDDDDFGNDDYSNSNSNENNDGVKMVIDNIQASMKAIIAEEEIWKDLQVMFVDKDKQRSDDGAREFLTAMEITPKSKLADRTVAETGLDKLPGVFLVSIDRPTGEIQTKTRAMTTDTMRVFRTFASDTHSLEQSDVVSHVSSLPTIDPIYRTIPPDVPLKVGDVLWFAGGAQSVGDLRKIPGLISYEKEEVEKIDEKVHDRRLVEAVIARRGPLVGKTVKQVRFRTRYGAAVIAVHRDGARIHEHPGRIRLQAGDVLLLEAGPTFIKGSYDNDKSFTLLAEVEDSAPPRLELLIPALLLTVAMLAVYTAGVASLLVCALIASMCMIALGILSEQEARDAVNWEVFVTIAAAFGIGTALVNSGVAGGVASFLVTVGTSIGTGRKCVDGNKVIVCCILPCLIYLSLSLNLFSF